MSFKIYKIISLNTEKYYIGSTTSKYLSSVLQQFIFKYKKFIDTQILFNPVYNIIDFNDLTIDLLFDITEQEKISEIINKYIVENNNSINGDIVNKCINKLNNINIINNKNNINKKEYSKNYYEKNKNKYKKNIEDIKKYYDENKDKIKNTSKIFYNEKKENDNKKISMNINSFFDKLENNSD
jgi:hypothetical protein